MRTGVLLILDGYGLAPAGEKNAIANADTPNLKEWIKKCSTTLEAAGPAVGLPKGQMGDSEVNHLNMGAGRVVPQALVRIGDAIKKKELEKNKVLLEGIEKAKGKQLHLIGMVSDGGVHSHIDHLKEIVRIARKEGIEPLIHVVTDGRDTHPRVAKKYFLELEKMKADIVSVMGRYYAMDRDKRWERTKKAYDAIMGQHTHTSTWQEALEDTYAKNKSDEFVLPTITKRHQVHEGDVLVFWDFREDRERQLSRAFADEHFKEVYLPGKVKTHVIQMMEFDKTLPLPTLFPHISMNNVLSDWLSQKHVKQLHIAETEKFAHVTYFFNGGREKPFPKEDRIIIASPKVKIYDESPRMSVDKITEKVRDLLWKDAYDVYIINFANSDMVGHTGNYEATLESLKAMDENIGLLINDVLAKKGFMIITADHGNAEEMHGQYQTSHTLNKVPFIIVDDKCYNLQKGIIPDVAPTMLKMLKIPKPKEMTGKCLIK